jgi:hypothetical protein
MARLRTLLRHCNSRALSRTFTKAGPREKCPKSQPSTIVARPKGGKFFLVFLGLVALILLVLWTLKKQGEEEAAYQRMKSSADATAQIIEKKDLLSELINSHERLVLYHKDQRLRPIEIKQAVDNLDEKITECVEGGALASQEADQYRNLMAAELFTEAYRLLAIAFVKIAGEMGVFDEGN